MTVTQALDSDIDIPLSLPTYQTTTAGPSVSDRRFYGTFFVGTIDLFSLISVLHSVQNICHPSNRFPD